jgi:DNA (cytosine-5)-methyltransferase 1
VAHVAGELTAVDAFTGIGGFTLGLQRAGGVRVVAHIEIDGPARRQLERRWAGVPLFGDIREVSGADLLSAGLDPRRGIITGGFPCQDLSVAGLGLGLGGARSGLYWQLVRLAGEVRAQWVVFENVPGLLRATCACSGGGECVANGRAIRCGRTLYDRRTRRPVGFVPDVAHKISGGACAGGCMARHGGAMGAVVGALGELGYWWAYRVLDCRYFGLAQHRDRVFIVGHLGDRAAPVEVLFEPEGGDRDTPQGTQAGPRVAGTLAASFGSGGLGGCGQSGAQVTARVVEAPVEVASTLQGGGKRGWREDAEGAAGGHLVPDLAAPVTSRHAKGVDSDVGPGYLVTHPLTTKNSIRGSGAEAGIPVIAATLTSGSHDDEVSEPGRRAEDDVNLVIMGAPEGAPDIVHPLTSEGHDATEDGTGRGVPVILALGEAGDYSITEDVATPITANRLAPAVFPIQDGRDRAKAQNGLGLGADGDPAYTLATDGAGAVAFAENQRGELRESDVAPSVGVRGGKPGQARPAIREGLGVRRLTPRECERLQGFPDDWTNPPGARQSDSARYRQIGNAVPVPVVEWIARRLVAVHAHLERLTHADPS